MLLSSVLLLPSPYDLPHPAEFRLILNPGPSVHLTNLIPSSTSLLTPSIPLTHSLLTRASPPPQTLALAACILDSLTTRFALSWRQNCPLAPPAPSLPHPHIDLISPELLILSALILAVKFLDDEDREISWYAREWGGGLWSNQQINFTNWIILENIGFRLLSLWQETLIAEAMADMERAGTRPVPVIYTNLNTEEEREEKAWQQVDNGEKREKVGGNAVLGFGDQMTPVETPRVESRREKRGLRRENKEYFSGGGVEKERFPVYVDPGLEGGMLRGFGS
jgi:hypothetical protein